tara:strand:- start:1737 stop:2285 length:549 start_codon:yes stop_codon:yes gene_type:complete
MVRKKQFTLSLGLIFFIIFMNANTKIQASPTLDPVEYVDIDRFMGKWYVIAAIPTIIEKNIYNAIEVYRKSKDGTIATTFTFRKGGFDGEEKIYTPKGFIKDKNSNAIWGMQFIWPIKADYRIIYLDPNYETTIIGRNKRDYLWFMSRQAHIPESTYNKLLNVAKNSGYDLNLIKKIPQRWP